MSRHFAAFDIDGTLIRWQLYHAIVDKLIELKYINKNYLDRVEESKANWQNRTNEESFREYQVQLIKAFDQAMVNLNVLKFKEAADFVFNEYKEQVYTYSRDLFRQLKDQGYLLFALSGSPENIIKKMVEYYGFHDYAAVIYKERSGKLTGKKDVSVLNKIDALNILVKKHRAAWENSVAIGDSEGDITMLNKVSRPIVFNPSKKLFDHALAKKWPIILERKNVIYKLNFEHNKYHLASHD